MTRYTHSPSLKARLVALVLARWQACRGTVQDGGNAGEEFLCVGICEVFFGYERSACIPTQIRKSCTWSSVVCTRNLNWRFDNYSSFHWASWSHRTLGKLKVDLRHRLAGGMTNPSCLQPDCLKGLQHSVRLGKEG
ncbi:hypothetical protein AVEN_253506-1 [Araneus ventricosus]|uniref:Secreted protein n=1 Tax=Araneus ventricosus TaxID=182803 RepID=A0A4Y2BUA3_ARAVE|nr:hypothetical protein AVEN_253506-1 [Araneus ventricosus]